MAKTVAKAVWGRTRRRAPDVVHTGRLDDDGYGYHLLHDAAGTGTGVGPVQLSHSQELHAQLRYASDLGVFASIFAYCLIVLRTIRGSEGIDQFVPSLAVFFAFLMSLGGVGVLIYFIHHIALSIQASSIIASVARETNACIDRMLPKKTDQEPDEEDSNQVLESLDQRTWYPVPAAKCLS